MKMKGYTNSHNILDTIIWKQNKDPKTLYFCIQNFKIIIRVCRIQTKYKSASFSRMWKFFVYCRFYFYFPVTLFSFSIMSYSMQTCKPACTKFQKNPFFFAECRPNTRTCNKQTNKLWIFLFLWDVWLFQWPFSKESVHVYRIQSK
jgi:hypothetical protein